MPRQHNRKVVEPVGTVRAGHGRVSAERAVAPRPFPHFARIHSSAMAVAARDREILGPSATLPVLGPRATLGRAAARR